MRSDESETAEAALLRAQKALVALVEPLAASLDAIVQFRLKAEQEPETAGTPVTGPDQEALGAGSPQPTVKNAEHICCSFCLKPRHRAANLIAGPDVYICADCVELCNQIIRESGSSRPEEAPGHDVMIGDKDDVAPQATE